jgi:2-desacetyl-2-hydroxyethyl bacteriochlorophyllide A dehydrogenase
MKQRSLYFTALRSIELREDQLAAPGPGQLQVHTNCTAISAGTELLLYGGEAPSVAAADEQLAALSGSLAYPLKYGYCAVGTVAAAGPDLDPAWQGRRVFAFNPHENAFNVAVEDIQPSPDEVPNEDAVFLANMETAVNLILDAQPRLGERAVVIGQGVVGLLATALLRRHPLDALYALDRYPSRRARAEAFGADQAFDPATSAAAQTALGPQGADLVLELSGQPEALNLALDLVGPGGRVVVGSWYGTRRAAINLDEGFHRGRIQIISSQVGQLPAALSARWDRRRRFAVAWDLLAAVQPSRLVSHRFPLDRAAEAYALLAEQPDEALAVLFTY